jgi:hypothetical protein
MKNLSKKTPLLHEVASAALHDAFLNAAERAKQTRTYLVVKKNGQIERIPFNKIDEFVASQNMKGKT